MVTPALRAQSGSLLPDKDDGSSRKNVPTKVMPPVSVFFILLVANAGFEAEIVNAWKAEAIFTEVAFDCILVHYTLDEHNDPIRVLDRLDRVRAGVFQAVLYCHHTQRWQVLTITAIQDRNA